MSEEQLKGFMEKVSADEGLQSRLKAATSPQAVADIAKEHGYTVSLEDLHAGDSLSDQELEAITGGGGGRVEKSCSWGCVCKESLPHEVGYPLE